MRPRFRDNGPTFAKLDAGRLICPCGMRFGMGFLACNRHGEATGDKHALIVRCVLSGHIITADGVVIGQREVTV